MRSFFPVFGLRSKCGNCYLKLQSYAMSLIEHHAGWPKLEVNRFSASSSRTVSNVDSSSIGEKAGLRLPTLYS